MEPTLMFFVFTKVFFLLFFSNLTLIGDPIVMNVNSDITVHKVKRSKTV